jgi:hypothetical protein
MAIGVATNFNQTGRQSIATIVTDASTAAVVPAGWFYIVVSTQGCSLNGGAAATLEEVWLPGVYGPIYLNLDNTTLGAGVGDGKLHAIGVAAGPGRVDLVPCTPQ